MRKALLPILGASLFLFSTSAWAQGAAACDLTADGKVDDADVTSAINMSLGSPPCAANVNVAGAGVCNVIVVQRVINAKLSATTGNPLGNCLTGSLHSATLNWAASTSAGITGYKIYRGTTTAGQPPPIPPQYTLLTTVGTVTTYTDSTVQANLSYYYVVTAVSANGESSFSNQVQGTIPTP